METVETAKAKWETADCSQFVFVFLNAHKQNAHGKIPLKHRSTNENWQDTSFINYTAMQSYSTNYIFMKYANVTDPKQLFSEFWRLVRGFCWKWPKGPILSSLCLGPILYLLFLILFILFSVHRLCLNSLSLFSHQFPSIPTCLIDTFGFFYQSGLFAYFFCSFSPWMYVLSPVTGRHYAL